MPCRVYPQRQAMVSGAEKSGNPPHCSALMPPRPPWTSSWPSSWLGPSSLPSSRCPPSSPFSSPSSSQPSWPPSSWPHPSSSQPSWLKTLCASYPHTARLSCSPRLYHGGDEESSDEEGWGHEEGGHEGCDEEGDEEGEEGGQRDEGSDEGPSHEEGHEEVQGGRGGMSAEQWGGFHDFSAPETMACRWDVLCRAWPGC